MCTSLDRVWRGRRLATCTGNLRHWRHAGSVNRGYLPHTGMLRCSRTTGPPEKEACYASGGAGYFAVGRGLAMFSRHWLIPIAFLLLTGCTLGPKYKRPPVTVPDTYRGRAPDAGPQTAASFGDEKWWAVFQDPQLQELIREALAQNYDVRIAAARVLQAQALLGITRADQFPTITGGASSSNERLPATRITPAFETSPSQVNLSLFWELDFWGKFRRATEAARAVLLASEWGRRSVVTSLVSEVAGAYFQVRALDMELDIAKRTFTSRQESLRLTQLRAQGGATSLVDVRQAEQLVFGAAASIADLERQVEQQENFISVLLGNNPSDVPRGRSLDDQPHLPSVPVGLPSALLER